INHRDIVFLDTPGHEAFTLMRARGAKVTDIVILVVAADDGVMPQTREAIDHARAANVPIIVAINKIDKPNANPERVKRELTELNLMPEAWGGQTVTVEVSAKKKQNIELLLEMVLLVSDIGELKANPKRNATGTVLEAKLDKGRGPVATVLVQDGTLHVGETFIAGPIVGRVRALIDDRGRPTTVAGPPVKRSDGKGKIRMIHAGVGAVNESDVLLASASNAIVIAFNVRPDRNAEEIATRERVEIRPHSVIYNVTDEMKKAMTGLL